MKKIFAFFFSVLLFFLNSCSDSAHPLTPNQVRALVQKNEDLFLQCTLAMESLGEERIYVALEEETVNLENGETKTEKRLVSYLTQSGDRNKIENEVLEKALAQFGFQLIFFQTGSDSRRVVIFSYTKESAGGIQNGFYYSYDALPAAWWGRTAKLMRKADRYLQINETGSAWYYTVAIQNHFYYFEKQGNLVA